MVDPRAEPARGCPLLGTLLGSFGWLRTAAIGPSNWPLSAINCPSHPPTRPLPTALTSTNAPTLEGTGP